MSPRNTSTSGADGSDVSARSIAASSASSSGPSARSKNAGSKNARSTSARSTGARRKRTSASASASSRRPDGTFTVGWLYPDLMNIYGDRGNVLTLLNRARWRGLDARLLELGKGAVQGMEDVDVFFFGGGQDREQALVYDDLLESKAVHLGQAVARGAAILAVCGGYQLLGHYYQTAERERFLGIGLLDAFTEAGPRRCIGDVVVEADKALALTPPTLAGFENHSGRTFLGPEIRPLGRVMKGHGNNGQDGTEGAVSGNLFGTYLHGSLLPKNPHLADLIIERALGRGLAPLDDELELAAHRRIVERELARR